MEDLGNVEPYLLCRRRMQGAGRPLQGELRLSCGCTSTIHSQPQGSRTGKVKLMEAFGPDLYRWERGPRMEHFVADVCGIEVSPEHLHPKTEKSFQG